MMFGGPTSEADSREIVSAARDAGVNFIDTADAYNGGESERVVGRAIAADRDRWVLATKLANKLGDDPNSGGLSRRWVHMACDASLKRLGTDVIAAHYLHKEAHATAVGEPAIARGDQTGRASRRESGGPYG